MKRLLGVLLVIATTSVAAMAAYQPVPEINPSSAVDALALLGGAVVVLRARLKK